MLINSLKPALSMANCVGGETTAPSIEPPCNPAATVAMKPS
jgi:hypothetical protein